MSGENKSNIDILELIDAICDEFRTQWKLAKRPQLSAFLDRVPENAASQLFRNLLSIDIRYRKKAGETPTSEDYLQAFPQFRRHISDAFHQSVSMVGAKARDLPVTPQPSIDVTVDSPNIRQIGEYELVGELGRGAFGVVYEAKHRTQGNHVALKTLPGGASGEDVSPERLHRFRREFRSLSEINHPNLVGMQSLEVDDGDWFFTMDLIEGTDFLEYVRPGNTVDETRLRSSLSQLIHGIIALHERRIIHRDLKPSNVLVEPSGRVVILDFGLVAQLQRSNDATLSRSAVFAGTPRYAAPEQMYGDRSEASDWYAVGTMVYEALTGESPFSGSAMEIMRRKQEQNPPSLICKEEFPTDLASLVDGWLSKEPNERPSLPSILETLKLDSETRAFGSSQGTQGSSEGEGEWELDPNSITVEGTELVGRDQQFEQLEQEKNRFLDSRRPKTIWVDGKSGEGKTTLVEAFLSPLRHSGDVVVFSGRCYDRESVPFKAIDSIVEPMVRFLRSPDGKELEQILPEDIGYLARLFPLLSRVDAISDRRLEASSSIEPEILRARAFYALWELLLAISKNKPLVISIDDLQWGDADSAQALVELMTHKPTPAILFLASYRVDEASDSSFLSTWRRLTDQGQRNVESVRVSLSPLTQEQCIDLVANRTGLIRSLVERQSERLFAESSGNPYLLEQIIAACDLETGDFFSRPLDEIIKGRLKQLPSMAAKLLEVIAISGQPLSIDEMGQAAGMSSRDLGLLTHMRSERLVRLVGDREQSRVDTYHDKIRETVLDGLGADNRRRYHLKLAECIEANERCSAEKILVSLSKLSTPGDYTFDVSPRVFDLAHHFGEAGDPRAFLYQLLAAEQSLLANSAEDAQSYYQLAKQQVPLDVEESLRFRMSLAMGQVFLWNKESSAAVHSYQLAIEHAATSFDRARGYAGLADAHRQESRFDESVLQYDCALKELGIARPKTLVGKLLSLTINGLRAILTVRRPKQDEDNESYRKAYLIFETCESTRVPLCEKDLPGTSAIIMKSGVVALRSRNYSMNAAGNSVISVGFAGTGLHWFGNICLGRAKRELAQALDAPTQALYLEACGEGHYWGGDPKEARLYFDQCIPMLQRMGKLYYTLLAKHMRRHCLAYLDTSSSELKAATDVFSHATEVGNAQACCWGSYDMASALSRQGRLPEALSKMRDAWNALPDERFFMTEIICGGTDSYVRLQCSDYRGAFERGMTAWKLATSRYYVLDVTLLCLPVVIESIAGATWTDPPESLEKKLLRRMIRRAALVTHAIPNHRSHLQRVIGRAYFALGKHRRAKRLFERSIQRSQQKEMHYQKAKALLDLAAVQEENRDRNRIEAISLLKKMESVIPRAESWLLGDQYDESVVAPEFDLEAWEKELAGRTSST